MLVLYSEELSVIVYMRVSTCTLLILAAFLCCCFPYTLPDDVI